jgi:hypothetical protein
MYSRRASVFSGLFLALFALPFAGVGVFMTAWLWHDVLESRKIISNWTVVPSVIESAELKSHRGSKGSITYQAEGVFAYSYEGRVYRSDRVSFSGGFDNVGDYQQKLHRRLKSAMQSGRRLDCRVNPTDPMQAILDVQWRPEMALFRAVFGIAFGGIGFGFLAGCILSIVAESRKARLKKRYPNEPWLWRAEWQSPAMPVRLGPGMVTALAVLFWINLATWPLWSALRGAWISDGVFKWVLSGALLLVLVASAFCVRTIIHARKYRGARLSVGSLPLRPGAPVEARLYLPQAIPSGATLRLNLVCERSVTTGRGKQRRTTKTKLWSHEHSERGPIARGQEIVVRCHLPASAEETAVETSDTSVVWRLEARADVPGVNLKLNFELPVFRGPKTV